MKRPKIMLRDLFWLTTVVGLLLALHLQSRQTISVSQHREEVNDIDRGWRWSFESLAEEHKRKTGVIALGAPYEIKILTPDGKIARKMAYEDAWEWKK